RASTRGAVSSRGWRPVSSDPQREEADPTTHPHPHPHPHPFSSTLPPPSEQADVTAKPVLHVPLSTVADTWGWLWKDTLGRLLPFALAAAAYARVSGEGPRAIGLTGEDLRRDLTVGIGLGASMLGVAIAFRAWDAPAYRLPTAADQVLQSAYYFALN